jgi:S1-C subfamily serine protease
LNINGELIGISTAIYAKAQGIGFAIPINKAKRVMDDLIKYGEIQIPWIGLFVQDADPTLSRYFKVPEGQGVFITAVTENSPAEEAGLQPGEVVTALGGKRVSSKAAYHDIIRGFSPGDLIAVTTRQGEGERVIEVHSRPFPVGLAEDLGFRSLGVRVKEISAALQLRHGITSRDGVVVSEVRQRSYLDRIGARPGDVIRKINEVVINSVADFLHAVIKYRHKEYAVVVIQRGDRQYNVTVKMEL